MPIPKLPLEPLLEAARMRNYVQLANALGMHHDTIKHYALTGVSVYAADRWAVRLGMHPGMVWSEWFDIREPWSHGSSGYYNHGCRCDICCAARDRKVARHREQQRCRRTAS